MAASMDVTFTGLKWLHSPSWTVTLYDCRQVRFDGLFIHTSLKEGVWADVQEDLPRRALHGRHDELIPPKTDGAAVLLIEDAGDGTGRLSLSHRLLSHADLTPKAAAQWHRPENTDVCWWPDPDVAYILQRRWVQEEGGKKTDVREEDLESRLGPFESKTKDKKIV